MNKREFCNAPLVESNACSICIFINTRITHLPLVKELYSRFPFVIIAPSKSAAKLWTKTFPDLSLEMRIEPHVLLKESTSKTITKSYEIIRIAYAGQGVHEKGWDIWRKFVNHFNTFETYDLFHLGSWAGQNPESFENVRVTSQNRTAMLMQSKQN
jgi:hypothetical protein